MKDTWLPIPPGALAPIPSPDGTITCANTPERSAVSSSRVAPAPEHLGGSAGVSHAPQFIMTTHTTASATTAAVREMANT
jgi:hypothetical protein